MSHSGYDSMTAFILVNSSVGLFSTLQSICNVSITHQIRAKIGAYVQLDMLVAGLEHELEDLGELGNGLNRLLDRPDMSVLL